MTAPTSSKSATCEAASRFYARVDALVSALSNAPNQSRMALDARGLKFVPGAPTAGNSTLSNGRLTVVEGSSGAALVALLRNALTSGTLPDLWLVDVVDRGAALAFTDPATTNAERESDGDRLPAQDTPKRYRPTPSHA